MREILFRGKRLKNRGWQWGCLLVYGNRCFIIPNEELIESEVESRFYWHLLEKGYEVDPETVGQFTGLTDKNGKKIFEGDIVTISSAAVCMTGVVEFHDCGFEVREEDVYECLWYDPDELEIIGNIHDNPELLGGADNA